MTDWAHLDDQRDHRGMAQTRRDEVPSSEDLAAAARQLRAVLDALPPATARDRATARRIEGAAVALEAVAQRD